MYNKSFFFHYEKLLTSQIMLKLICKSDAL